MTTGSTRARRWSEDLVTRMRPDSGDVPFAVDVLTDPEDNPWKSRLRFTGLDFLGGGFRNSAATIFVTQKHWNERKVATGQLVGEFFMKTAGIKEALVLAFGPPPIFGLGNAGGFEFYVQNRGEGGPQRLFEVTQQLLGAVALMVCWAARRRTAHSTV